MAAPPEARSFASPLASSAQVFDAPPSRSCPHVDRRYRETVRLVDLDALSEEAWQRIAAGEHEPFGALGDGLTWRHLGRHVGVRDGSGELVATAGVGLVDIRIGRQGPTRVAGIGGVIVTRALRGRGLGQMLIERVLEIAGDLDVERAMLFCIPENLGLYAKFGFRPIEARVTARQRAGPAEIPMPAMWKPLDADASWPPGTVEVLGEPF